MFWCEECKCAYPHGPEGPDAALRQHREDLHGGQSPGDDVAPLTGRRVVAILLVLAALGLAGRLLGFHLM